MPGSWIIYGLRLSGLPEQVRLALAVALSPPVLGLQLMILEAVGVPFRAAAYALVVLNLPCILLLARRLRIVLPATVNPKSWLAPLPLIALLVGIPVLIWALTPGFRAYAWNAMIHTDIIYTVARDGVRVEEANLAGLSLAYGWVGHGYWSVISHIGDWPPTQLYPYTNVIWIIVTFVFSYYLGREGLGIHRTTALLGAGLMFLGTNVIGMLVRIFTGQEKWWIFESGDIRYTPFLGKYYGFETIPWGLALLVAVALVCTVALRKQVASLNILVAALLVGLGLVYPVLFPAGLVIAGCLLFLMITRLPRNLPEYSRPEIIRFGGAVILSTIAVTFALLLMTADREKGTLALSAVWFMRIKVERAVWALLPFGLLAAFPLVRNARLRQGPALLLGLSALAAAICYVILDLAQLEYKFVLAATICLAFLAAAALDPLFRRSPRLGFVIVAAVTTVLAALNLLLVFQNGGHIPGNLSQAARLNERSFWLALAPAEKDSAWTTIVREVTPVDAVVIARKPGLHLSTVVGRSMYIPSDIEGGTVPGYNLDQRFYLLDQRGYSAAEYDHRLDVVDALYTSDDERLIIQALQTLKELHRPLAIDFNSPDTYALQWLREHALGIDLFSDLENTVWLVDDPDALP